MAYLRRIGQQDRQCWIERLRERCREKALTLTLSQLLGEGTRR